MNATPAVYFSSLEIDNVRCFGGRQELDLTFNGRPAQWVIIIGENGTGKTTLLECLAWMRPVPELPDSPLSTSRTGEIPPLTEGTLNPALPDEDDEILETLPRSVSAEVKIGAQLEFGGVGLHSTTETESSTSQSSFINVGMNLTFNERGQLHHLELTKNTEIERLPKPFHDPLIVVYGANRHLGERNMTRFFESDASDYVRLSKISELCDVEEFLMGLDYAASRDYGELESKVRDLLKDAISRILPEEPAVSIDIHPPDVLSTGRQGGVYAQTFTGIVRMSALSLGYRTTAGWVVDLALRLSNRYPSSENPLSEPAVVLIDEIDLHLHPRWQLVIMRELSSLFPGTQFIATTHSPLIVQVAEEAKLILLEKQEGQVNIENYPDVPRNLRVDHILTSLLFGVPISRNPSTQRLLDQRAELLDKIDRTEEEEDILRDIQRKIDELEVAHDHSDEVAMDLIRRFAARLEREEENGQ